MTKPKAPEMTKADAAAAPIAGRTAVMSGNGRLPEIIADELAAAGANPFVLVVTSDSGSWYQRHDHKIVPMTHLAGLIAALKKANVQNIVLAGGVKIRPSLRAFRLDWMTVKMIPRLYMALRKGDDGLLSVAVNWLESFGFTIVGPHQLIPSLLSPAGILTLLQPDKNDLRDMDAAKAAAQELGLDDVGQAAVVRHGEIAALEDRQGTQAMLAGLAASQTRFTRSGVLAKFAKPQQETRVDLPAIGPETVDQAAAAGLAGIVVEAGRSLILDRETAIGRADDLGLFIVGMQG
jgi:UDP-2,3-diacylglucosamine hydrolase